jgi:hypothetical protein
MTFVAQLRCDPSKRTGRSDEAENRGSTARHPGHLRPASLQRRKRIANCRNAGKDRAFEIVIKIEVNL